MQEINGTERRKIRYSRTAAFGERADNQFVALARVNRAGQGMHKCAAMQFPPLPLLRIGAQHFLCVDPRQREARQQHPIALGNRVRPEYGFRFFQARQHHRRIDRSDGRGRDAIEYCIPENAGKVARPPDFKQCRFRRLGALDKIPSRKQFDCGLGACILRGEILE